MKQVKWILAIATTLTSLSALAGAQSDYRPVLVAQVPFEFKVGDQFIPAGRCEILSTAENRWSLAIRNTNARVTTIAWASTSESKYAAGTYALIFNRYGDRYFLAEIRLEGSNENYRLPPSKAEAELRAQNEKGAEEVLIASRR